MLTYPNTMLLDAEAVGGGVGGAKSYMKPVEARNGTKMPNDALFGEHDRGGHAIANTVVVSIIAPWV
eukprot:COSAG05_NODE_1_length_66591_cov_307.301581_53_plen_67_part_00